jgi:hypothetical protein
MNNIQMKNIPFISLMNNDGTRRDGIGRRWRENWSKCFNRRITSEEDVCAGDKGSIGIGYWIPTNLDRLIFPAKTDEEKLRILIDTHPIVGYSGSGGNPTDLSTIGKPVSKKSLNQVVDFYNFAQGNEIYFAIKRGTKGLWLAKKTSKYYHAPQEFRAEGIPLYSEYQKTSDYFEHRFCFEIVRNLTKDEASLPGCRPTIRYKTIAIPM